MKKSLQIIAGFILLCLPSLALADSATQNSSGSGIMSLLIIYVLAISLAMVEIFLIPGFGMFGVASVCALAFCGYQAFMAYGFTTGAIVTLVLFVLAIVIVVVALKIVARTEAGKAIILDDSVTATATDNLQKYDPDIWVGREMKAASDLRPAGNARYEDETHNVTTEGAFLRSGDRVRVFKVKDNKLYVEAIESEDNTKE